MTSVNLKTIQYRGGIVRFRIPAHWHEEYEEDGGGTFYAPGDDTGTLRLEVMTAKAPAGKTVGTSTPAEVLQHESQEYAVPIVPLREGVAMIRFDLPAEEKGQTLMIRYWRIAQVLPPRHIRLVLFSYTLLSEQLVDPSVQSELKLINDQITHAQLAPVLGEQPPPGKN